MNVGFIGCGKMGEAILSDLIRSGKIQPGRTSVCEADTDRCEFLHGRYGVEVSGQYEVVLANSDVVFLAVKPQGLDAVLDAIAADAGGDLLLVSIAAGKRLGHMERILPDRKILRVMPNLATLVSEGMSVFCAGGNVDAADREIVSDLLSCFGTVLELPEAQFDAVTALSGSGPAFFACFLQAMIQAGTALGLKREDAELLAIRTMLGTAKLLANGLFSPEGLIAAVSSAKGTTVAGMAVLESSDLKQIVDSTLNAAAKRSEELSR